MATYNQGSNNEVPGDTNAKAVAAVWATSINPTTHARDSVQFTLTVNGAGFIAGSVIEFDGVNKTTTVVSPTQVTCPVTLAGAEAVRSAPVRVKAGNGFSTPVPFAVT